MNPSHHLLPGAFLVIVALFLGGCGVPHDHAGGGDGTPVSAATTIVAPATATVYSQSPGTLVATRTARIASRLSGYVQSLDVDVGDRVKAGQLLLTIDNRDVEAQVAQARAVYDDAAFNYRRYTNLYKQQAVSRQEYEAVKRNYTTAKAGLAQAEAQRAYAEVRAPFAGVVTARSVEAGDLATPGKSLLVIQAPGHLEVHTQITNRAYAALATGKTVYVAKADTRLAATVVQLSPAADPATETHLLKAALITDSGLSPGEYVDVLVPVGTYRALFVPDAAVLTRTGLTEVFVVDTSHHAHLRMVRLGARRGGSTEILSGLRAGERIVSRPGDSVINGSLIQPASP